MMAALVPRPRTPLPASALHGGRRSLKKDLDRQARPDPGAAAERVRQLAARAPLGHHLARVRVTADAAQSHHAGRALPASLHPLAAAPVQRKCSPTSRCRPLQRAVKAGAQPSDADPADNDVEMTELPSRVAAAPAAKAVEPAEGHSREASHQQGKAAEDKPSETAGKPAATPGPADEAKKKKKGGEQNAKMRKVLGGLGMLAGAGGILAGALTLNPVLLGMGAMGMYKGFSALVGGGKRADGRAAAAGRAPAAAATATAPAAAAATAPAAVTPQAPAAAPKAEGKPARPGPADAAKAETKKEAGGKQSSGLMKLLGGLGILGGAAATLAGVVTGHKALSKLGAKGIAKGRAAWGGGKPAGAAAGAEKPAAAAPEKAPDSAQAPPAATPEAPAPAPMAESEQAGGEAAPAAEEKETGGADLEAHLAVRASGRFSSSSTHRAASRASRREARARKRLGLQKARSRRHFQQARARLERHMHRKSLAARRRT